MVGVHTSVLVQVFHFGGIGAAHNAILGILSWFAMVSLIEVVLGKVAVRGDRGMTMESIYKLARFFIRTTSIIVNRIKRCCNTFHGHIITVFANRRLMMRFRGFWGFAVIGWGRLHLNITLRGYVGRSSTVPGFVRWVVRRSIPCWCWTRLSMRGHTLITVHSMAIWKMSSWCGISILLFQSSMGSANIRGSL